MGESFLSLKNISKSFTGVFGSKISVLHDLSLDIFNSTDKTVKSILAPFGGGKTTLLKIIAGLEQPSSGEVLLEGKNYDKPAGLIAYIPEKPSSFPWLNVKENISFFSEVRPGEKMKYSADELIDLAGLTGYEDHHPHKKSAGFRFRISLARAIAFDPKVILIDDSFKSMNAETRQEIYLLLKSVNNKVKTEFLLASTNITDAINLSKQIFLMKKNPGSIFKVIENDIDVTSSAPELQPDKLNGMRKKIELSFKEENKANIISFSI